MIQQFFSVCAIAAFVGCVDAEDTPSLSTAGQRHPGIEYKPYTPQSGDRTIVRSEYAEHLYGFWLGECIANWTGLVTEMDKIGDTAEFQTLPFYTRADWGQPDQPSIWGEGLPSDLSPTIDFVFRGPDEVWGSDDDTDLEYMYLFLHYDLAASILSPEQIRTGWLKHIRSKEPNYLWVSNERAFHLMEEGMLPPATSLPENNAEYAMIDAQLTTEIFGLFAPMRPEVARKLAYLPIRTTAREDAAAISEFYVTMHALAADHLGEAPTGERMRTMAAIASECLPEDSYAAAMYAYVLSQYESGVPWEAARDGVYQRYQIEHADGYDMSDKYGDGCFAAGINFAASLVSLFWGEGDLKETIKIGSLCGWDSDNPTATWGGLLGFMLGRAGVEAAFGREFSSRYDIHRTRQNFPEPIDEFAAMARRGVLVVDQVVQEQCGGGVDPDKDLWFIPAPKATAGK